VRINEEERIMEEEREDYGGREGGLGRKRGRIMEEERED
jgi:hypothetical protein